MHSIESRSSYLPGLVAAAFEGHGNPEPIFVARSVRVMTPPRVMKDRHMRCVGWDWASRCMDIQICTGSLVDLAYRLRQNDHPEYGGIEIELAGIRAVHSPSP